MSRLTGSYPNEADSVGCSLVAAWVKVLEHPTLLPLTMHIADIRETASSVPLVQSIACTT